MIKQTEVHRIRQELAMSNVTGEALLRKFRTAARGDVKLACALRGYFADGNEAYLPYLQTRLRPAATELILAGSVGELAKLDAQNPFTPALTEEFLETAILACVPDSIIWLLKMKERRYGFHPGELTF